MDAKILELNCDQKSLFFYLLCEASFQNKQGKIDFNTNLASTLLCQTEEVILQGIERFKKLGFTSRVRNADVTLDKIRLDKIRLDKTREEYVHLENASSPVDVDNFKTEQPEEFGLEDLSGMWNAMCTGFCTRVVKATEARKKAFKSQSKKYSGREYWIEVLQKLFANEFLNGTKPSATNPNWKASLDWLLNEKNHVKVFEGFYERKKTESYSEFINQTQENYAV